jgi:TolB-like protein/class 3 adenylate cyclase/Flp pilus assembly protein TadD
MKDEEHSSPTPPVRLERKLAAILSADVKGYSRLMGEDEATTIRTLTAYRQVMATLIQQHHGRVVDSPGDNLLAEFASAVDATQCAVEIQRELKARNTELPFHRRMEFRIGINVGDVVVEEGRLYGDGVNIAARLEGLAEGGGICISGTVYDQIKNKLSLEYESLGEQTVKNITEPVRVYRVTLDGVGAAPRGRSPEGQPHGGAPTISQPGLPLPDKPSIAVLPFANMSSDPEQEYFSDGMTEDLITDLSKLSGLFVIARHSVFTYKGKAVKVQDVSRELGVRYVVEGSVRKAGDRVRITAQLVDASTGHHLWADRYDGELKDIFALQDAVTQKIVAALQVKLTKGEQEHLGRAPTDNLEAYDYFLRGWESFQRFTKEANIQAQQLFERAVELDPEYAEAYAGLGMTYWFEWAVRLSQDPQYLERAFELTQRAVALDDSLSQAHTQLGWVYLAKKQYEEAFFEMEKAIALNPNDADAYARLGGGLLCLGRPEEAIRLEEKAMRLDPHYPPLYVLFLGMACHQAGRYEEAITAFKRARIGNPEFLGPSLNLTIVYSELGREEEARAEAAEVLQLNPHFSVELFSRRMLPYKDPAVTERLVAALRKAGLQ